jgi:hypothetical protein
MINRDNIQKEFTAQELDRNNCEKNTKGNTKGNEIVIYMTAAAACTKPLVHRLHLCRKWMIGSHYASLYAA